MRRDVELNNIAQRLIECFNGGSVSVLAALIYEPIAALSSTSHSRLPAVSSHPHILGNDRRTNDQNKVRNIFLPAFRTRHVQLGKVCSDPGQSAGRFATIKRLEASMPPINASVSPRGRSQA